MNAYLLLPLVACVASATLAVAILMRDPKHPAHRVGAALISGASAWAFFEVLWNVSSDPVTALWLVRCSSLGWVALGPLALHLFLTLASRPHRQLRRMLPVLYAVSLVFFAVNIATEAIHTEIQPAAWGWAYALGPTYYAFYVFTVSCILLGMTTYLGDVRGTLSPGERRQALWLGAGIAVPLVLASLTDGLLPAAGIQVVHLGTISFTVLGGTILWSFHRYGYSLLAPGAFAGEILEVLPDGVALLRPDGRIRLANGTLEVLSGHGPGQLERTRVDALLPGVELRPEQPLRDVECELRTATAETLPVSVTTADLRDRQGDIVGLVLAVRDLRELTALRRSLVTSARLAAVGQLAAGIAHEINNPIAFVRSNLTGLSEIIDHLESKLPAMDAEGASEGRELVEEALDGVDRVASIVRDVGGISRSGPVPRQPVDLDALLDRVLRVASPQLGPDVRVERMRGELPQVPACEPELQQVFLNLVVNAAQAVGDRGEVRVATRHEEGGVSVVIEDDGPGIPQESMERIFDPFFTTKPAGEGTGLGLSISYEIVRRHGGRLTAHSPDDAGARFHVWLPV